MWELSGIPCCHAISAISYMNGDPDNFVAECLKVDKYKEAYSLVMRSLNGENMWPKDTCDTMLPPKRRRMPGIPKMKRRNAVNEELKKHKNGSMQVSRVGRIMHCTYYKSKEYNMRKCSTLRNDLTAKELLDEGYDSQEIMYALGTQSQGPPPTQDSTQDSTQPNTRKKKMVEADANGSTSRKRMKRDGAPDADAVKTKPDADVVKTKPPTTDVVKTKTPRNHTPAVVNTTRSVPPQRRQTNPTHDVVNTTRSVPPPRRRTRSTT